ncbi:MAG: TlpA family protein disulfide reductase [Candidatus Omnitrophica bacterium]|nr:TlpA family protein disulfide reductase [Candidatus Omnitrophota bacterium]
MRNVLIAALILCFSFEIAQAAGAAPPSNADRKPAPDFQLAGLNGKPLSLSALKGKVVLLDFWATWCPPCRAEIPHFKELYAAYKGKGLEMVGLAVSDKAETVKEFVRSNGVPYPIAVSSAQAEQAYGGIRGIPTTFLIDKQGRIAEKYVGYQEKQVFESRIQALLEER